jgi:heme/copper-type cytochrome/quinol oxidase subunit 2
MGETRSRMLVQYVFEIFYLGLIALIICFIAVFYILSRRPARRANEPGAGPAERTNGGTSEGGMEKKERSWLYFLLAVVLIGNLVTLSPLIPSASYGLWSQATPVKTIVIEVDNYHFVFPGSPIVVPAGKVVEFIVISHDVTYGFGVFRKDGTMVFQMQVVPEPYKNTLKWVFDEPGMYDVRSTEYSGPQNPFMYFPNAIEVEG